jgi:hypothetical protein
VVHAPSDTYFATVMLSIVRSLNLRISVIGQMLVCSIPRSRLKHSRTEAPTELRRVNMEVTIAHLLLSGSYRSTEFSEEEPSLPPRAKRKPLASTTSCVDLKCTVKLRETFAKKI